MALSKIPADPILETDPFVPIFEPVNTFPEETARRE
jgi:hypothetical protein